MSEPKAPFLRRVVLRNYKSIRKCDVSLDPLVFLVGPNGSGKSNFLDALRFLSDSLRTTMQHAVDERGEVRKIFWWGKERSTCFSIQLYLSLPDEGDASYTVTIGDQEGLFVIEEEHCVVDSAGTSAEFHVVRGEVKAPTLPAPPPASESELYLRNVSGFPEFSVVHELLKGMRFFNIDPQQIREEALSGEPARDLQRNGKGALFAAHRAFHDSDVKERLEQYMAAILPAFHEVGIETTSTSIGRVHGSPIRAGGEDLLAGEPKAPVFRLLTGDTRRPFDPRNISDGTLRAFGVLLALFQCRQRPAKDPIPLVGIEEPESTLHPAAAGVLFDALHEASHFTQVLVTTHSAELLDIKELDPESLLVVDFADDETVIGPADEVSLSAMKERMYTAGELLEMNQLRAAPKGPEKTVTSTADGPSAFPPNDQ